MELHEFQARLIELLNRNGSQLSEAEIRRETAECRYDIYKDTVAHGGRIEEPFLNFVVRHGVAVFTFFESEFAVFVISCDEYELINQTGPIAMSDVAGCRQLLAQVYRKHAPDLVVSRALAEYWLSR